MVSISVLYENICGIPTSFLRPLIRSNEWTFPNSEVQFVCCLWKVPKMSSTSNDGYEMKRKVGSIQIPVCSSGGLQILWMWLFINYECTLFSLKAGKWTMWKGRGSNMCVLLTQILDQKLLQESIEGNILHIYNYGMLYTCIFCQLMWWNEPPTMTKCISRAFKSQYVLLPCPSLTSFICLSPFFAVKYMREATAYVKRGSPVSEIGWETPPPESPRLGSPPVTSSSLSNPPSPSTQPFLSLQGDRRCIPLKMCYVTRAMTTPDPENR